MEEFSNWRVQGRCATEGSPKLFFKNGGGNSVKAVRICKACPVRQLCLNFAIDNGIEHGIWGGMTARERKNLVRRNRTVFLKLQKRWAALPRVRNIHPSEDEEDALA